MTPIMCCEAFITLQMRIIGNRSRRRVSEPNPLSNFRLDPTITIASSYQVLPPPYLQSLFDRGGTPERFLTIFIVPESSRCSDVCGE